MPAADAKLQKFPLYTSTSMLRVFTPGDCVETDETVQFADLRVGDIVVFTSRSAAADRIIHRIIRRTDGSLTTMGDNNPAPDSAPVTADQLPALAVAKILPDGRRIPLARGAAGMRQFRMNRLRYWTSRTSSRIGRLLEPLMFWRLKPRKTKQFGDDIVFYAFGRPVAQKTAKGVRFTNPFWKLLFRVQ
ncbi:MAG: signal peptidase I [Victivallales bacterium]|nr:signal peptidase I [Victivallales bacterium]